MKTEINTSTQAVLKRKAVITSSVDAYMSVYNRNGGIVYYRVFYKIENGKGFFNGYEKDGKYLTDADFDCMGRIERFILTRLVQSICDKKGIQLWSY